VLDRRLLELIPIDSVTLSNEHGHGERANCRRSALPVSVCRGAVSAAPNTVIWGMVSGVDHGTAAMSVNCVL
jgi:hypothetical protein